MKFTRVKSDINGNPRYVVHFLECCPESWREDITYRYTATCKLMNRIGGRKYNTKSYGGGVVFQSYSLDDLQKHIEELIAEVDG
jgi:hypothetical protein